MQRPPPYATQLPTGWWTTRSFALLLVLLTAVPLLWPGTAPLIDLPGHMARYRVELGIHNSAPLARYYGFEWALMGNLGVDLLVVPLAPILGLELAVKLIVLAIPVMTAAGLLLIAREEHGALPPSAAFALPLAYGFPFQFGFVNFALSMALALLGFGLWLRLGRLGQTGLRAIVFVPIGAIVWLAHGFGWGVLGLLVFASEMVRERATEQRFVPAAFRAGLASLPLAPPLLLMVLWRSGNVAGQTGDWFNWTSKLVWMVTVLRDRWLVFDVASTMVLLVLVGYVVHSRWSFKGHGRRDNLARTGGRFVIVSLVSFGLNSFWVWLMVRAFGWPIWSPYPLVLGVTPFAVFWLNRRWVFE